MKHRCQALPLRLHPQQVRQLHRALHPQPARRLRPALRPLRIILKNGNILTDILLRGQITITAMLLRGQITITAMLLRGQTLGGPVNHKYVIIKLKRYE